MLKLILLITLGVPNVAVMEHDYSKWLDYSATDRGKISQELAAAWNAPAMQGRKFVLMRPASGANIYLRFVQVDAVRGYVPMRTVGWNAIESLVQDPDGLAQKLAAKDSPFKVAGLPRPLGPNSPIRAMQAIGPAGEVLYFTKVPAGPIAERSATTYVDRPFVMILGGLHIDALKDFYHTNFGQDLNSRTSQGRITVLNKAFGLNVDTTHPISGVRVSPQYSVELDEYPAGAAERPTRKGELPPAIAMVSFEVESLDEVKAPLLAPQRPVADAPYDGRRVAVVRGATGELIELIEAKH